MAAPLSPSAGDFVAIHLLDSAQGHPLQTWRFAGQDVVTIGRDESSDIVLADPQVSRTHAKLIRQDGQWTLISQGRHGTLVNDRVVSEAPLRHQTLFRLGPNGPMLRFDSDGATPRRSETIDQIDSDLFSMLEVDQLRKQQEVDQIAENALFQELQEKSRRLRTAGPPEAT
jgi:pSer/pThr/pTyr-binding forkhead associated (FHA) protein